MADYEKPEHSWGFLDTLGEVVIAPVYDDVVQFSEGKAAVNVDGLWGFVDKNGKQIIKPQFRSAYAFHENRARVKPFNEPECFIRTSGEKIASTSWEAAGDFSEGLARVKVGQLFGFIDSSGSIVIKAVFTRAWNFQHDLAKVESDEKQGVINHQNKFILPATFDKIIHATEANLFLAMKDYSARIYDAEGKLKDELTNGKFLETDGVVVSLQRSDGMWLYRIDNKKILNEDPFQQLFYLGEKRWGAKTTNGYQIIDQQGNPINDKTYSQINKFSDGLAAFRKDKLWGYVTVDGIEVTETGFGLAWDYKEGFARAAFEEGIAFINRHQKIAFVPVQGTMDLRDFSEGLAPFQKE
jgi:hypothetical protein